MGSALLLLLTIAATGSSPYQVSYEDVSFPSGELKMAGTLFRPKATGPVPAVVLIHGSGQTDRSSLRYFATKFAKNGIAALAYDKRGVGKSEGPPLAWRNYNFNDLASDAAAAVAYLRTRPDIDGSKVGIFGASQGGWVAPLAARRAGSIRFLVMVSASVCTVAEDNLFERDARLRQEGFSEAEIKEVHEMHLVDLEVSRSGKRFDEYSRLWEANKSKKWFRRVYLGDEPMGINHPWRQWYRTIMDFDPVPVLEELKIPTIWLFGDPDLDRFGPVRQSVEVLERLRASGKDYEIKIFPGADHSLQLKHGEAPFEAPLLAWLKNRLEASKPGQMP